MLKLIPVLVKLVPLLASLILQKSKLQETRSVPSKEDYDGLIKDLESAVAAKWEGASKDAKEAISGETDCNDFNGTGASQLRQSDGFKRD